MGKRILQTSPILHAHMLNAAKLLLKFASVQTKNIKMYSAIFNDARLRPISEQLKAEAASARKTAKYLKQVADRMEIK